MQKAKSKKIGRRKICIVSKKADKYLYIFLINIFLLKIETIQMGLDLGFRERESSYKNGKS